MLRLVAACAHAAAALAGAGPPPVTLANDASNVPELPRSPADGEWPPPAPLSHVVKRLPDGSASAASCQRACLSYVNTGVSPVSGWTKCQSFTYANGSCYARMDATWAPTSADGATSGRVSWPAARCRSVRDCSHNGECSSATSLCDCQPAWTGDRCQTLRILPAVRNTGLVSKDGGANTSSWGGTVSRADDGSFHMLASEMTEHCGINAWASNSHVVHAVSSTPGGAYRCVRACRPPDS